MKNKSIFKKAFLAPLLVAALALLLAPLLSMPVAALTEGDYTYTVSNGEATITDVNYSIAGAVTIPSTLGGYPVTAIGNSAFIGCRKLTSITIPSSVTVIGNDAFYLCSSLASITIPSSVTSIGSCAFQNCTSLVSVTFGESSQLTSIDEYTFRYCSSLTSIEIPSSVTSIGEEAFSGCSELIQVENGVSYVDKWAIDCDESVISVALRENTVGLGNSAFRGCSSLMSIEIPSSLASIGSNVFWNCSALTSIEIPHSVKSISPFAFSGCSKLTSITVDPENTVYHSAENCVIETSSKTLITSCKNSVIPADGSVTNIGKNAFYGETSLKSIAIPSSVTNIESSVFEYCGNLEDVYYVGTSEQWENVTIASGNGALTSATIHFVPCHYGHKEIPHDAKTPTCTEIGWDTYVTCSVCDYTTYEEIKLEHSFDCQIAAERYLKTPATTTDCAVYYKSCICGEKGTATFSYGSPLSDEPPVDDAPTTGGCGGSLGSTWTVLVGLGVATLVKVRKKKED